MSNGIFQQSNKSISFLEASMHEDLPRLLPDLQVWNNGQGISPHGWLNSIARYDHAAAYAMIFWPDFIVQDDSVFMDAIGDESMEGLKQKWKANRTRVEALYNHRHIVDLFFNSELQPSRDWVLHTARLLKDMWQTKLKRDFPNRNLLVEIYGEDSADLIDCQITFFEQR